MESNDMKAMREALVRTDLFLSALGKWLKVNDEGQEYALAAGVIHTLVERALAKPPRQCDVGTAEEQIERFNHQCFEYHTGKCSPHCRTLPAKTRQECALKWAQMPYKEGGAK